MKAASRPQNYPTDRVLRSNAQTDNTLQESLETTQAETTQTTQTSTSATPATTTTVTSQSSLLSCVTTTASGVAGVTTSATSHTTSEQSPPVVISSSVITSATSQTTNGQSSSSPSVIISSSVVTSATSHTTYGQSSSSPSVVTSSCVVTVTSAASIASGTSITSMATGVHLRKFDGTENALVWLSNLQCWTSYHNLSDDHVLQAIGCNLEGPAASWFLGLPDATKQSKEAFVEAFKTRFNSEQRSVSFINIRQLPDETTDKFVERAEKMAIGHNIPEDYKVQLTVNGLDAKFKQRIISKEPKTFQELRHALALAKAELECAIENPTANISVNEICAAVAAQLQQTIKQEVSAIASAHNIGSGPQQQPRFQKQWHPRPQNQWRQSQPQWQNGQFQNQWGHGQWQNGPNTRPPFNQQQRQPRPQFPQGRRCSGCGKSCFNRTSCPSYNTQCANCLRMHHFAEVCRSPPSTQQTTQQFQGPQ